MAQLSTIISSILRDMIVAQHEANIETITTDNSLKSTLLTGL